MLLGVRTPEGGYTNDWRKVEKTMILVAKQKRMRSRGINSYFDATPLMVFTTYAQTTKTNKRVKEDTLEELIRNIRDLRVEMSKLKKPQGASSSQSSDGAKSFVKYTYGIMY